MNEGCHGPIRVRIIEIKLKSDNYSKADTQHGESIGMIQCVAVVAVLVL